MTKEQGDSAGDQVRDLQQQGSGSELPPHRV